MERSRVTVEYSYLPDSVFEHEVEGIHCVIRAVDGPTPDLRMNEVLAALQMRLDKWPGAHAGFPLPVTQHEGSFKLVKPATVFFDLWPRILCCDDRGCAAIVRIEERRDIHERRCPVCHRGNLRQLPYYMVRACGQRRQLQLGRCPTHGNEHLSFVDTGSFYTAHFRCRDCGNPTMPPPLSCNCSFCSTQASKTFLSVTARDSRALYPHHLTLVTIGASRVTKALAAPRGPHYALGHYLGLIEDLSGLDQVIAGQHEAGDTAAQADLLTLIEQFRELDPQRYAAMRAEIDRMRGDDAELDDVEARIGGVVLTQARTDRRLMERAQLFQRRTVKLDEVREIWERFQSQGHHGMAQRLADGIATAEALGLSRIAVIRDFPIALVAFGFTRQFSDERALLRSFEPSKHHGSRYPLVAIDARTEAVYVELNALTLWHWCQANGWTSGQAPADPVQARTWLLAHTFGASDEDPVAVAVRRLTHVWSHLLALALAGRSSFDPNSVAEYLMERTGSLIIYASSYTAFTLGALISLVEQHLGTWLDAAVEGGTTCVHDPVCLSERGGCHKCLALAFGCERFNRGLDRGYLVGGGTVGVKEGFLTTAGRLARISTGR